MSPRKSAIKVLETDHFTEQLKSFSQKELQAVHLTVEKIKKDPTGNREIYLPGHKIHGFFTQITCQKKQWNIYYNHPTSDIIVLLAIETNR